jgi:hypothetical protein
MPLCKDLIYETLKSFKVSAPGPDGIPYSYYKKFWKFFSTQLKDILIGFLMFLTSHRHR